MRRRYGPSPAMKPVALLQTSTFAVPAASSTIEPLTARGSRVAARIPAHPARTPDARAEPGGYAAMLLICVASATRRLGAGRRRPGLPRRRQRTRATPAVFANASVLRCDLPREGLGDDLPILYHEGIRPDLVAVVRRLGLPEDVGGVAVDVLPQHLERRSGLGELLELRGEQLPNGLGPLQHPVRGEQPRLG